MDSMSEGDYADLEPGKWRQSKVGRMGGRSCFRSCFHAVREWAQVGRARASTIRAIRGAQANLGIILPIIDHAPS
jgi:hypothetical protein